MWKHIQNTGKEGAEVGMLGLGGGVDNCALWFPLTGKAQQ